MKYIWIYAVIPVVYSIMFFSVRGGFLKSAHMLNIRFLSGLSIDDGSVRTALLVIFAANIAAAVITVTGHLGSTAEDGYLLREDYNGQTYTQNLELSISGEEQPIEIEVAPRSYSETEKEAILSRAAMKIESIILEGQSAGHINQDLKLISSYEEMPIVISWVTDRPDILDWDGKICRGIPEEGTDVVLTASLEWGELEKEVTIPLTIFPKELTGDEALREKVNEAVSSSNNSEDEKLILPDKIDGKNVVWHSAGSGQGLIVLFAGLLFAALFLFSRIQNRDIQEAKRQEALLYDYPHLVNKLVLLLNAGMSMRAAFEKTAHDYRISLKNGGPKREGFDEILRMCADMEKGVSEIDAYRKLGERSKEAKYRTFSTLLVQNLRKGSGELINQLEREAGEAFEERKKRARILGEQAGTKLMFPMMLMLMVVFAILMIPAMISF